MPYKLRRRGDRWCVVVVRPANREEVLKCHQEKRDALDHLAALKINVEGEEFDAGEEE